MEAWVISNFSQLHVKHIYFMPLYGSSHCFRLPGTLTTGEPAKSRWIAARTKRYLSLTKCISVPSKPFKTNERPQAHGKRPRQDWKESQSVMQGESWISFGSYDWYEQDYIEGRWLTFIIVPGGIRCRMEVALILQTLGWSLVLLVMSCITPWISLESTEPEFRTLFSSGRVTSLSCPVYL